MDPTPGPPLRDPLIVTGLGAVVAGPGEDDPTGRGRPEDITSRLASPKMRKFLGKQDRLAVAAAGKALDQAGLDEGTRRTRLGLYLTVGAIPFERSDVESLTRNSLVDGTFSMKAFSELAIKRVNPLMTFRCLPNMPAFHVSLSFGIQGPYQVGYPGPGQLYSSIQRARAALARGDIDAALVGGVADQRNFLVRHHVARLPVSAGTPDVEALRDAAGFLVFERAEVARRRGATARLALTELTTTYAPPAHASGIPDPEERLDAESDVGPDLLGLPPPASMGPASLPALLALALSEDRASGGTSLLHQLRARDGVTASSRWELLS